MTTDPTTDKMTVVFACDDGVALPLAVALRSVLACCRADELDLIVIDGGLSADSKQRCLASTGGKVEFLRPHDEAVDVVGFMAPDVTAATHLRFQIPMLLPDRRRAIYLDTDVVVLQDLAELWRIALADDCPFGAVIEMSFPRGLVDLRPFGFGARGAYCNAGVLLMNLEQLRRDRVHPRASDWVATHQPPLADQDALNVLFEPHWQILPPKWNTQVSKSYIASDCLSEADYNAAQANPGVAHFAGRVKPWHLGGESQAHWDRWDDFARQIAWSAAERTAYVAASTMKVMTSELQRRLRAIERLHPGFDRAGFVERIARSLVPTAG